MALVFSTIETVNDSLTLLIMKPDREIWVTWPSIARSTMSNLTLVTVGIAVKNFITRTAAAKADVEAMQKQLEEAGATVELK